MWILKLGDFIFKKMFISCKNVVQKILGFKKVRINTLHSSIIGVYKMSGNNLLTYTLGGFPIEIKTKIRYSLLLSWFYKVKIW